ncbi:helix-turn-helix domain-containing protein [Syntrophomonas curvata]
MFGSNLRRIRKQKMLSQADLAEKIGKIQQTVSWYESGRVYPSLKVIENIAQALDVSAAQLIEGNSMDTNGFRCDCAYPCSSGK